MLVVGIVMLLFGVALQRRYQETVVEALGLDVEAYRRYMAGDPDALDDIRSDQEEQDKSSSAGAS